jgi:uncharacterized membrane protein
VNKNSQTKDRANLSHVEKWVEIDLPIRTVYNQYTQFEDFPKFMEGVKEVRQLNDQMLHWKVEIGGIEREFQTKITEQKPDDRIAWCTTDGKTQAGVVTFHRLSDDRTRVTVQMSYDPEGFAENLADALGVISGRLEGDLERFKEFIESRGRETGAWRGEIRSPSDRQ